MQPPASERPVRRADHAIDAIVAGVLDGRYPAGSVLPAERELAREMGISRTSLREALTRLEQLGVVTSQQGRGTVVLDIEASTDPSLVARLVQRHGLEFLEELFEVRQGMGRLAGRLAALRATPADLRSLEDSMRRARDASDAPALQAAEIDFFAVLVAATHNRPLRTMMRWTEQAYGATGTTFAAAFADAERVVWALERIVAAVGRGDPGAAELATSSYAEESAARMLAALHVDGG